MVRHGTVWRSVILVSGCNGILFSYFAEGPFYLIQGLGLSPSAYGLSFVALGASASVAGMVSRRWQKSYGAHHIIRTGLGIVMGSTGLFSVVALIHHYVHALPANGMIAVTVVAQMVCLFGTCMTSVNALAIALVDYKHAIGTASSLFGFTYYGLIALLTFVMGCLHNGTLLPMPLYFAALSVLMLAVMPKPSNE